MYIVMDVTVFYDAFIFFYQILNHWQRTNWIIFPQFILHNLISLQYNWGGSTCTCSSYI